MTQAFDSKSKRRHQSAPTPPSREGLTPNHAKKMIDRPNPDQLLAQLQSTERSAHRGRLKIFFGANAGVGKTYAMLSHAQRQQTEGTHVLVGLVETHGRTETAELLKNLTILPRAQIIWRDRTLQEFDLDAALAHAPQLILVDELAHSNVPGSRHARRWQDVEELLAAGIDVYTTINVQHLESLNDVVGSLTGVRVRETVPDHVFDAADEVTLVDLPPDELLQRLQEGKVYLADAANRAREHFFKKVTSSPCVSWHYAAPQNAWMPIYAAPRPWAKHPATGSPWPCHPATLAIPWCAIPPGWQANSRRAGCRGSRNPSPDAQCQPTGQRPQKPATGRHARRRNRHADRPRCGANPGLMGTGTWRWHPGVRPAPGTLVGAAVPHNGLVT